MAILEKNMQMVALPAEPMLMDSIEASLSSKPDLNIVRFSADPRAPGLWPAAANLILTDLDELHQRTILGTQKHYPDTPTLRADTTSDRQSLCRSSPTRFDRQTT